MDMMLSAKERDTNTNQFAYGSIAEAAFLDHDTSARRSETIGSRQPYRRGYPAMISN